MPMLLKIYSLNYNVLFIVVYSGTEHRRHSYCWALDEEMGHCSHE